VGAFDLDTWLGVAVGSLSELGSTALACDNVQLIEPRTPVPQHITGAMISIVGERDSIELAVSSTLAGCQVLAKALMCMEPTDEDLPHADLGDSIGEISNMVAGGIKNRMTAKCPGLRLGLPFFVDGIVEAKRGCESGAALLELGTTPVYVVVLRNASNA
jgi:hypothetical protein